MRAALAAIAALAGCSTETMDLGRRVTTQGFGPARWAVAVDISLDEGVHDIATGPSGDVYTAAIGHVEKRAAADGRVLWTVNFGSTAENTIGNATAVRVADDGSIYTVVRCEGGAGCRIGPVTLLQDIPGHYVLVRISPDGAVLGHTVISQGTTYQQNGNPHLLVTSDRAYVSFPFVGTLAFPDGTYDSGEATDAALLAFDAQGTILWTRHFHGRDRKSINGLALADDGDLLVAGPVAVDGGFGTPTIVHPVDGADYAAWIARFAPDGTLRWQHLANLPERFGGDLVPLATLPDGQIAMGFTTSLDNQVFRPWASTVNAAGDIMWTSLDRRSPAPGGMPLSMLEARTDGTLVVGGKYGTRIDLGTGATTSNGFLAAYDPTGRSGALPAVRAPCPAANCTVVDLATGPNAETVIQLVASDPVFDVGDGISLPLTGRSSIFVMLGAPE